MALEVAGASYNDRQMQLLALATVTGVQWPQKKASAALLRV
jgi:hypothetical protein